MFAPAKMSLSVPNLKHQRGLPHFGLATCIYGNAAHPARAPLTLIAYSYSLYLQLWGQNLLEHDCLGQ